MPPQSHTPEALLGRSDSKNPATTCRGLTAAGKPCRRSIAAARTAQKSSQKFRPGVFAVFEDPHGKTLDASFYCWQHRGQAIQEAPSPPAKQEATSTRLITVNERTSIDSLVARLGVDRSLHPLSTAYTSAQRKSGREAKCEYKRLHSSEKGQTYDQSRHQRPTIDQEAASKKVPRKRGLLSSWFRCFQPDTEDDYYEIVRHRRPRVVPVQEIKHLEDRGKHQNQIHSQRVLGETHAQSSPELPRTSDLSRRKAVPLPRRALSELPLQSSNQQWHQSPTQTLLDYIPNRLSPELTATLLAELSKPISPHDNEGYIYIFWLTDTDKVPDSDTASSLISQRASRPQDIGALARNYSRHGQRLVQQRTIMLKIGRASNVHRRMTEWTQQCGYALSLVRWYPYLSSSPQASPRRNEPLLPLRPGRSRPSLAARESSDQVRKVPHVHRVERLIHLELADKRVKRKCETCGKEHREWFEVEATEEAVKAMDDVVRRWIAWAERHDINPS
ncbi:hypothetical protein CAC42_4559 [Sphaceloma murrayae]|uniref:Bacteriophage T5 Orf172 DNA-binding domain-containing protein n=1 Tax=Sphaceloma murrayae TaxID=2082308 RepID=A0A2K1QLY2_9PEZI|nr:hypothetical protein CAC42_4559 [Sphaceloma murrayae]